MSMVDVDINTRSCISPSGLLKWVLMISSGIILGLILYEDIKSGDSGNSNLHDGEGYVVICAAVTVIIVFVMLLLFFLNCHTGRGICSNSQCGNITLLLYFLGFLAWIAAAAVEIWVAYDWRKRRGSRGNLFERRCASAAMGLLNIILLFLLGHQMKFYNHY